MPSSEVSSVQRILRRFAQSDVCSALVCFPRRQPLCTRQRPQLPGQFTAAHGPLPIIEPQNQLRRPSHKSSHPQFPHPIGPSTTASVTWDSRGLRIDAANSSLQQILSDVATATGAKVQGMATDQRVFGDYGPGPAREVLSQLLNGSGYNILMIGDQGQGAPLQIVLTPRPSGSAAPSPNTQANGFDDSADSDVDEQPSQPLPAIRPGFGPGAPIRTPQQVMEEMQQRQQEMQRRQNPPDQ
jgi:hypothetical protein